MTKFILYFFTFSSIFPLIACQKIDNDTFDIDNKSYINNFELIQKNTFNDTLVKINSSQAVIDISNNDIDIIDSSIEIQNNIGPDVIVKAG